MKLPRKIAIGFQEGICPLRCNKCLAFGKGISQQKEVCKMPMDKVKQLICEIAQMETVPIIQPCMYAEPLANPDLREIINYCNEQGIAMSIITNGILMDDQWIEFLINNTNPKYTISFSLDALTQTTYEKVRGKYMLEQIERQIIKLIERRGYDGPRVTVNFTVEEDNDGETVGFIEKWKNKVDGVRATVGVDMHRQIPMKYRKCEANDNAKNQKCLYLDETMVIDSNGHVRACTFDAFGETDFGSVFDMGILGIWNSEKMMQYRKMQEQGNLSQNNFCSGCEAGTSAMKHSKITEEYVINEGDYAIYYNIKDRYNLPLR